MSFVKRYQKYVVEKYFINVDLKIFKLTKMKREKNIEGGWVAECLF
jgi:hypothetical protein